MPLSQVNNRFPRLKLEKPLNTRDLLNFIAERSTLSPADTIAVIYALQEALLYNLSLARPVRLEGIGLFRPSLKLDGSLRIRFKPDKQLLKALNENKGGLKQKITHRKNLGKSLSELEAQAD
jgi:hypothetical protein